VTKERISLYCAIAYLACGIIAFGHSAANAYPIEDAKYRRCASDPKAYCFDDRLPNTVARGAVSGFFWPLYFSWEMQS